MEAALGNVEPLDGAQERGSEKDLDGVQERGVTDSPARLSVAAASVLEEVRPGNEGEDVLDVLGIVVELVSALVAERIWIVSAGVSFLFVGVEALLPEWMSDVPRIMSLRTRRASLSAVVVPAANCSFAGCPAFWKVVSIT